MALEQDPRRLRHVAFVHPANTLPLITLLLLFVASGALLMPVAVLLLDLVVLGVALRFARTREVVARYARWRARKKVANGIRLVERSEWEDLEALVARTRGAVGGAQAELESLLGLYVQLASALARSSQRLEATGVGRIESLRPEPSALYPGGNPSLQPIVQLRRDCLTRAEQSVEAIRDQLAVVANLVRLHCEQAIASSCDDLGQVYTAQVDEAAHRARLEAEALLGVAEHELLA